MFEQHNLCSAPLALPHHPPRIPLVLSIQFLICHHSESQELAKSRRNGLQMCWYEIFDKTSCGFNEQSSSLTSR